MKHLYPRYRQWRNIVKHGSTWQGASQRHLMAGIWWWDWVCVVSNSQGWQLYNFRQPPFKPWKLPQDVLLLHQWWQQDANSSLDTNESLEFQSQHQMSDVAGWHFATCAGVPLYFVLACTWSKATLGSDNHSHGSWTNIVMAPTDTRARSFSSTRLCIKKK